MTFWIVAAGLTGLTCLALLTALGREIAPRGGHEKRFYAAQIAEIERQLSLKLIDDREADSARTEAARRLLASAPAAMDGKPDPRHRRLAAVLVLVAVPAIALPVYFLHGAPDAPSFPLASREKPKAPGSADFNVMAAVQQIETHLAANPDDGRGHDVVAPVYFRLGRHADAARAYAASIRLLGATADRQAGLGEALVHQADGIVLEEARRAFAAAAALDARHAKARFFLALAAQQDGARAKAAELFEALRDDLPDGALKAEIGRHLAELGAAPSGSDVIAQLPPPEQAAAVRSMVEGLAQRLATTGGTADEWARLIRALAVLNERERANAILGEARQKFASKAEDLRLIEDAGRGL